MKNYEQNHENNEKMMKNYEKTMKTMRTSWKWKTEWKQWENHEKHCKNNEKIMKRSGSRTSTQQLARGLRPIHPGYYNGALQRGNTTGKQNGKQNGKIKNEKMWKVISIFFKSIYLIALNQCVYLFKSNENLKIIFSIFFDFFHLVLIQIIF